MSDAPAEPESDDELRARARFAEIAAQHAQERERAQVTRLQERVRGMTYEQMMARTTGPMLTAVPPTEEHAASRRCSQSARARVAARRAAPVAGA